MTREWQPGDVAMVAYYESGERIAVVRVRRESYDQALEFSYVGGGYDMVSDRRVAASARPLVVIDPEGLGDDDDVARLSLLIGKHHGENGAVDCGLDWYALQAALREFANPTPPCGASLTLGKDAAMYRCTSPVEHDGPHADGTCVWTAAAS